MKKSEATRRVRQRLAVAQHPPLLEKGVTPAEIAVMHGVSTATARRWIADGLFKTKRVLPSGRIEIPLSAYCEFLEARQVDVGIR